VLDLALLGIPFHPFSLDLTARLDYFVALDLLTFVVQPKSCLQISRHFLIIPGGAVVMRVKVDFLDDPNFSAALSLGDLTRPSFFTPACKHKGTSSSVCWKRWKHIQCFHFVYASPRQAALYSRPDVPHYSESAIKMKSVIAEFLPAHRGQDYLSHYHLPHKNSITNFFTCFQLSSVLC
jgi:hypothetical protein